MELRHRAGVAKLFESPSHFSKLDFFLRTAINTYLKGMQKGIKIYLKKLYLLNTYK